MRCSVDLFFQTKQTKPDEVCSHRTPVQLGTECLSRWEQKRKKRIAAGGNIFKFKEQIQISGHAVLRVVETIWSSDGLRLDEDHKIFCLVLEH